MPDCAQTQYVYYTHYKYITYQILLSRDLSTTDPAF